MDLHPTQLKFDTNRYWKHGFSVIPLGKDKRPLLEWREYQTRQPALEELREWFRNEPPAIGIVTGRISGIVVLDIEHDAVFDKKYLPPTVIARTGGGGWHYYYRYPEGVEIKNSVKKLDPKIDIRSDGGYVVAPPSLHPSGNHYEWIIKDFQEMDYLPEWIIKKLGESEEKKDWKEVLKGAEQGQRNNTATSLVGKILHYLPLKEWETIGYEYLKGWNRLNTPPLEERELEIIFLSIAKLEITRRENETAK